MRIVIAGGHGKIARLLARRLNGADHRALSVIRDSMQVTDITDDGSDPLILDLEKTTADGLVPHLVGADAVVFAAGAGAGSGAARKLTIDRDGAALLADAAEKAGVRRYVMISAMNAENYDEAAASVDPAAATEDEVFQIYLRAKADADADLRRRDLDWTIVRPGRLTDAPAAGTVTLAPSADRGDIPREDVAEVLFQLLATGAGVGAQLDLVEGETPVREAVAAV